MDEPLSTRVESALSYYPPTTRQAVGAYVGCNLGRERRSATLAANGRQILRTAPVVRMRVMNALDPHDRLSLTSMLGLPVVT